MRQNGRGIFTIFFRKKVNYYSPLIILDIQNVITIKTNNMQLRTASRQKAKIRLGLSAVSGGGKTYSAILIAKGLTKGDLSKVAIIDTENGSADLYAHLGNYNVLTLPPPYAPEKYVDAIKDCENAGMEVIIIDSITHEWNGKGGILEIHGAMTGNSFTNWASLTPRHQKFIDAILTSKCHIITTVRRKQDYDMTKDGNGKVKVEKTGLKEETREGFEYELTANLELDLKHNATAQKDRTGLFMDKPHFVPSEETGTMLLAWCESGVEPPKTISLDEAIKMINKAKTIDKLKEIKTKLTIDVLKQQSFIDASIKKYNEISNKAAVSA